VAGQPVIQAAGTADKAKSAEQQEGGGGKQRQEYPDNPQAQGNKPGGDKYIFFSDWMFLQSKHDVEIELGFG
jgi:hypothetical protein